MVPNGPPLVNLERIKSLYPIVMHGVSMGIGSTDPIDKDYLLRLKHLIEFTETPWFSDHLCWTRHNKVEHHDLLPLPYTKDVIEFVSERAKRVQGQMGIPFALENLSSYAAFERSEMPEWEFYRQVVETADCYMMLDINNVYVSAMNHGFDPMTYLKAIPWERVLQIHIAGHSIQPDGFRIDTHDTQVCDEVWGLYQYAMQMSGGIPTLLEWDDHFMDFPSTLAEAKKAFKHGLVTHD